MAPTEKFSLLLLIALLFSQTANATQITIVNSDGANEGFNDTTPTTPAAGNTATTLGAQRLRVFQFAASIWEAIIDSDIEILVDAQFDPLTCSTTSAVLGAAGAMTVSRDFPNAPISNTWYAIALANSLEGSDMSTWEDISATFNSDIDNNNNCLNGYNWYYGLDGNRPPNTIELLSVVMHEIGHGLGFQTFVNLGTGSKLFQKNDTYMLNLEDHSSGRIWSNMNNQQRVQSAKDTADLHWTGPNVTSRIAEFTGGVNQGHIRQYAPSIIDFGSSVSHFSTAMAPNELMEPFDTGPKQGPGLAIQLFQDMGWNTFSSFVPIISQFNNASMPQGTTAQTDFVVRDNDTPLLDLTFSFTSSNTALIDASGFSVTGSGNLRALIITPNPGTSGIANITITVSDGVNSASGFFQLTVTNTVPNVTIDVPADGISFAITDTVIFQGTATDTEDGDISTNIQWSSSIDAGIGAGNILNTSLTEGTHIITASITDSGGLTSTSNVTVYIIDDTDNDGMNDLWEMNNFATLTRDGTGDFDGDGISDLDEYLISITVPDGDINNDGAINVADVLLATRHITGLTVLSALQISRSDIYPTGSPDGVLNISDLILLHKIVSNIP